MKKLSSLLALLLLVCVLLSACAPETAAETANCNVVLAASEAYDCKDNIKTVSRGSDVSFTLRVHNGYRFRSASYFDYQAETEELGGESEVRLTLKNVRYSVFVEIALDEVKKSCKVALAPSEFFRCDAPELTVQEGEDAEFALYFAEGYTFESVDYPAFRVSGADGTEEGGERLVILVLEQIEGDVLATVKEREAPVSGEVVLTPVEGCAVIGYDPNGGFYRGGKGACVVTDPLTRFPRPNTSQGTDFTREGYVLTGWNTDPDGEGTRVGLGSRAPVYAGQILLLYAQWEEWTDPALFDYVLIDVGGISELYSEKRDKAAKLEELVQNAGGGERYAVVTGYHGALSSIVIPAYLGGFPVAAVAPLTCSSGDLSRVVFPETMRYIMERAFLCPSLKEIVLFDDLAYIDYNAFGTQSPVETIHINAATPPIYGTNESAQLANKLEFFRQSEGNRTVFFGSCATWYGINAAYFTEKTGRNSYNLGVEGDTGILFQLDLWEQFLHAGDTLVYICDLGSPYLMMYDFTVDQRAYRMVEADYDLLSTVDMTRYNGAIGGLNDYLITKRLQLGGGMSGSYSDFPDGVSERGDMEKRRNGPVDDLPVYRPRSVSEVMDGNAFENTEEMIVRFLGMGIDVHYGFGPICEESLMGSGLETVAALDELFVSHFASMSAALVHTPSEVVLPRENFFDQPYRLTNEASLWYTDLYIDYFED